jgi:hypothetical protein
VDGLPLDGGCIAWRCSCYCTIIRYMLESKSKKIPMYLQAAETAAAAEEEEEEEEERGVAGLDDVRL